DGTRRHLRLPRARRAAVRARAAGHELRGLRSGGRCPRRRARMRYGPHPEHVADVAGDGATVAILHGGCWRASYDRTLTAAIAADLAGRGYRVANVEYRRLDAGGTWPEPL